MLSGYEAYDFMTNAYNSYKNVSNILKTNIDDVPTKLETFLNTYEELKSKIDKYKQIENNQIVDSISNNLNVINKLKTYVGSIETDSVDSLRNIAVTAINNGVADYVYLIANIDSKYVIVSMKNEKKLKDLNVSNLVIETSQNFGGGASKDETLSIGGGPKDYSIDKTLMFVNENLNKIIK